MTYGELFAGIGGMSLGLERAGMEPRWFVEIDDYCRQVLRKHWPDVPQYGDVRDVGKHNLEPVDLVAGGFPCPVVSSAAHGKNVGEWMWPEFRRVVEELEPAWVVVENVDSGGAWTRWVPIVRRELADIGYASLPIRLRASDMGAPFRGSRVYVAAAHRDGESARPLHDKASFLSEPPTSCWQEWGEADPDALGVADGVPHRMERLRAVGNAVVPVHAEWIGKRIMEAQP